ncbi:SAF domain-containing protein [Salinibacterium sp. ZJ454]|uniref:SAF domain-containing protein n=1 Tax=Salinibacterium sp. ZJ454 TaxID=2708339 RepID=UPI001421B74C|nr:SAF domain-containing protein [Salinibacterium sp. ZJ454]
MARTPTPRDVRPRSFWLDPRFGIGLLLVAGSVVGVVSIVAASDSTVQVYAARSALSPGQHIDADDLVPHSVRLGEAQSRYIGFDDLPADGLVLTRAVAAGELLPVAAVGAQAGARLAAVVIEVTQPLSNAIEAGVGVDLWAARIGESGAFEAPAVLVGGALVVAVVEDDGIVGGGNGSSVEVLVPRDRLASVLEVIANDAALSLVPVGIPVRG